LFDERQAANKLDTQALLFNMPRVSHFAMAMVWVAMVVDPVSSDDQAAIESDTTTQAATMVEMIRIVGVTFPAGLDGASTSISVAINYQTRQIPVGVVVVAKLSSSKSGMVSNVVIRLARQSGTMTLPLDPSKAVSAMDPYTLLVYTAPADSPYTKYSFARDYINNFGLRDPDTTTISAAQPTTSKMTKSSSAPAHIVVEKKVSTKKSSTKGDASKRALMIALIVFTATVFSVSLAGIAIVVKRNLSISARDDFVEHKMEHELQAPATTNTNSFRSGPPSRIGTSTPTSFESVVNFPMPKSNFRGERPKVPFTGQAVPNFTGQAVPKQVFLSPLRPGSAWASDDSFERTFASNERTPPSVGRYKSAMGVQTERSLATHSTPRASVATIRRTVPSSGETTPTSLGYLDFEVGWRDVTPPVPTPPNSAPPMLNDLVRAKVSVVDANQGGSPGRHDAHIDFRTAISGVQALTSSSPPQVQRRIALAGDINDDTYEVSSTNGLESWV
jgi:hypothetical protein